MKTVLSKLKGMHPSIEFSEHLKGSKRQRDFHDRRLVFTSPGTPISSRWPGNPQQIGYQMH